MLLKVNVQLQEFMGTSSSPPFAQMRVMTDMEPQNLLRLTLSYSSEVVDRETVYLTALQALEQFSQREISSLLGRRQSKENPPTTGSVSNDSKDSVNDADGALPVPPHDRGGSAGS